jgi:hypothetical protein
MVSLLSGGPVTLKLAAHELTAIPPQTQANPIRETAFGDPIHPVYFAESMAVCMLDADGRTMTELSIYPDSSSRGARLEIEDNGRHGAVIVAAITGHISAAAVL